MTARIYATAEDLAEHIEEQLGDAEARDLLEQSSLIVEDLLANSDYRVDDDGYPTEERVKDAIKRATCKQARHLFDVGGLDSFSPAGRGPSQLGTLRFDGNSSDDDGLSLRSLAGIETILILKSEGLFSSKVRVLR